MRQGIPSLAPIRHLQDWGNLPACALKILVSYGEAVAGANEVELLRIARQPIAVDVRRIRRHGLFAAEDGDRRLLQLEELRRAVEPELRGD